MIQPRKPGPFKTTTLLGATLALVMAAIPAQAQSANDQALLLRIEQMERELADLKAQVGAAEGRDEQAVSAEGGAQPPSDTARSPVVAVVAPRALLAGTSDVSVHVAGYADTSAAISDRFGGTGSTFFSGTFNPALYVQYRDLLLFESEVGIAANQDGETEFDLEFAQFDLLLHDNVTLVAGKYLSPVGQFQERLHPSWINRLADPPAGFGHGGVQPNAEVGMQLRGGVPLGGARFTYALSVGNGPRLDGAGEVMTEGFGGDDNGNKAISGRIGFLPLPYLEVGASMLRAKVRGPAGEGAVMSATAGKPLAFQSADDGGGGLPASDVDYALWGADAAYTRGPWDVRLEYLRGVRDAITTQMVDGGEMELLPRLKMTAWYSQIAYRMSGLTQHPVLGNFEPVLRYGEYKVSGLDDLAKEAAEERWDFGLNYWVAPQLVLHSAVQRRTLTGRDESEGNRDVRLLLKMAYGF